MNAVGRWTVLLCAAALPLTACGGPSTAKQTASPSRSASAKKALTPKPHTLVFSVDGSGTVGTLTYTIDGEKHTEHSVHLPWKKTVHVPAHAGGHRWKLTTDDANGTSTAVVYVDGKSLIVSSCSGSNCHGTGYGTIRD